MSRLHCDLDLTHVLHDPRRHKNVYDGHHLDTLLKDFRRYSHLWTEL